MAVFFSRQIRYGNVFSIPTTCIIHTGSHVIELIGVANLLQDHKNH